MASKQDRISRVVRRRGIAMVALLAAALTALIVAPAPIASAGRNTTGIQLHNKTLASTLQLESARIEGGSMLSQGWEDNKGPWVGQVIAPDKSAHYELLTQSRYVITSRILFKVVDRAGVAGGLQVTTIVDGTGYLSNYGAETTTCSTDGPFDCKVSGTDSVTITDRDFFRVSNQTSSITFKLTAFNGRVTYGGGDPFIGRLLAPGQTWDDYVKETASRPNRVAYVLQALDAAGHEVGRVQIWMEVKGNGQNVMHCDAPRDAPFRCHIDDRQAAVLL